MSSFISSRVQPAPSLQQINENESENNNNNNKNNNDKMKQVFQNRLKWILILVAALSPSWILIQAITIFLTHEAAGLSWLAFLLTVIFSSIWLFYGCFVVEQRDWLIVASSISTIITSTLVLVGIKMYGNVLPTASKKRRHYVFTRSFQFGPSLHRLR
jgi:uncharacterized protein with PQ loop repeat